MYSSADVSFLACFRPRSAQRSGRFDTVDATPTSGAGHFSFALSGPANVRIRVHSVSGRLVDEVSAAGNRGHNQILWEPPVRLAGGSYLYRITAMGDAGMATADGVIQVKR